MKLRYTQTVLGIAWAILQPLAGVAIFTVVFGRLVDVPSDGVPYPVFVYAGLILWFYFSNSVEAAAQSLVEHADLVTKVYFPRLLAPLAAVMPGLVDLVVSVLIVAVFMTVYEVVPGAALALLPLTIVGVLVVALAAGLWLSALNALYRDVRYVLGFLLQLAFFASPVVFPSSLFEGNWQYVYAVNPMAGALDAFRWSLVGAPPPGLDVLVSLVMTALMFGGGLTYFRRVERRFADRI